MENGLKTEINNGIDNLQLLIKSFQQNVQKLRVDNEIFNERYQSAEDGILQLRSHVISMMNNAPDQNSKTFEQLQRREINQQIKMVMNQINEIKNKQQDMQNKHQEMIRQYDSQQKLITQQNTDIQQIQDLQK